MIIVDLSS